MKLRKSNLLTSCIKELRDFYVDVLGLEVVDCTETSFTVIAGWTELSFTASSEAHRYHYCFLVPNNLFIESMAWVQARTELISVGAGDLIADVLDWNSRSFYFYDASGNIVEFIARLDLDNDDAGPFAHDHILGLNEIGFPVADIAHADRTLSGMLGTAAWKGNNYRFGTHGDQNGMILLPNYDVKETWFPTEHPPTNEPFEVMIEVSDRTYYVRFIDEDIWLISASEYRSIDDPLHRL